MAAVAFVYRYPYASGLAHERLELAPFHPDTRASWFFEGQLAEPDAARSTTLLAS